LPPRRDLSAARIRRKLLGVLISGCLLVAGLLQAAQTQAPLRHEHNGIIPPYEDTPPRVLPTASEQVRLEQGDPVYKRIETEGGDRVIAIFRVNAPPEIIWSVIADFASYPEWIDALAEAEVYKRDGDDIYVRFRVEHWLAGSYTYYIRHHYPLMKTGWGTWTLDYSRVSELDDSVGFWRVTPVPGTPTVSDVTYSADVRLKGWLPGFMRNRIVKQGIQEATSWVKIQSEARFTEQR
jgi:Polyketide cyclase / dehydrase and lipid transport.